MEQVFGIAPLKMVPGASFELKAFSATLQACQANFAERIAALRQHSYQVLRAIIQD